MRTCDKSLSIAAQIPAVQCSCAAPMKKVDTCAPRRSFSIKAKGLDQ